MRCADALKTEKLTAFLSIASQKMVGFITEPKSVKKVLDHLDLPTEAPPVHPPRPPPQMEMEYIDEYAEWQAHD